MDSAIGSSTTERIFGCLSGIAIGDAIGKQTEGLSFQEVERWYPSGIHGFEGEPGSIIPRYVGHSKHEWRVGETSDDTERTRFRVLDSGRVVLSFWYAHIGRLLMEVIDPTYNKLDEDPDFFLLFVAENATIVTWQSNVRVRWISEPAA